MVHARFQSLLILFFSAIIEAAKERQPILLPFRDGVKNIFHVRGKPKVHIFRKMLAQEEGYGNSQIGWRQCGANAFHIAALLNDRHGRCIRGRPSYPLFFQSAHQGGFRIAGRRLGLMRYRLKAIQLDIRLRVCGNGHTRGNSRQLPLFLAVIHDA
ncbi:MAG: hypothetical protein BWY09_02931 [Candidatus Hydrogenedentes bacterium ADurb.Bin179]|nr:MAG: hypothetical protein BWY09_02931 [Candidatus Hydrogenedentes bacterium ADurb.Bin179]